MRRIALVVALASLPMTGCRTVSQAGLDEAHVAAAAGDGVLAQWGRLTDDQKQKAVWKLTRAEYSVLNSCDGTAIPPTYTTGPWATEIAPVSS